MWDFPYLLKKLYSGISFQPYFNNYSLIKNQVSLFFNKLKMILSSCDYTLALTSGDRRSIESDTIIACVFFIYIFKLIRQPVIHN